MFASVKKQNGRVDVLIRLMHYYSLSLSQLNKKGKNDHKYIFFMNHFYSNYIMFIFPCLFNLSLLGFEHATFQIRG